VSDFERVPKGPPPIRLAAPADTPLSSIARHYMIFNHGCIHTYGGVAVDVIGDFVANHPDPHCQIEIIAWPDPIFRHIDRQPLPERIEHRWDHRLLLCPKEYAADLHRFLRTVGCVDERSGAYAMTWPQIMHVPDRYAVTTSIYGVAAVPVYVYGIAGNWGSVSFTPLLYNPKGAAARVECRGPIVEVATIGSDLLGGASNPFHQVDPLLQAAWLEEAIAQQDKINRALAQWT